MVESIMYVYGEKMNKYKTFRQLEHEERKYLIKDLRKTLKDDTCIADGLVPDVVMELAMNMKVQENMIKDGKSVKYIAVKYRDRIIDDTDLVREMLIRAVSEVRHNIFGKELLRLDSRIDDVREMIEKFEDVSYVPVFDEFKELELESLNIELEELESEKLVLGYSLEQNYKRLENWT